MSDVQDAPHKVKKYDILRPDSSPEYKVVIESSPRRVRVVFNGETVSRCRPHEHDARDAASARLLLPGGRRAHGSAGEELR